MSVIASTHITRWLNPVLVHWRTRQRLCLMAKQGKLSICQSNMQFLEEPWVNYVSKCLNPTDLPEYRPIEDFFVIATLVYSKNWVGKDTEAVRRRIRACIERIPAETVLRLHDFFFFVRIWWAFSKFTIDWCVFKIVQRISLSKFNQFKAIKNLVQIFMHHPLFFQI